MNHVIEWTSRRQTDLWDLPLPLTEWVRARRWPPSLLIGGLICGLMAILALAAPLLAPYDPNAIRSAERLLPPSPAHLLGTDRYGRDMLSRLLFAARLDLWGASLAVLCCAGIGVPLGMAAGYAGRWIDQVLSRLMDIWLSVPGMLVAIVTVAVLGPSLTNAMLAVGIMTVPILFRTTRAGVLACLSQEYVESARAAGGSHWHILRRHILPNSLSTILVTTTLQYGMILLAGSGLSFLGFGAQPPQSEWGTMLAEGKSYLHTAWWLTLFPGLMLALAVLGINLLGDGLRDLSDPVIRRC